MYTTSYQTPLKTLQNEVKAEAFHVHRLETVPSRWPHSSGQPADSMQPRQHKAGFLAESDKLTLKCTQKCKRQGSPPAASEA